MTKRDAEEGRAEEVVFGLAIVTSIYCFLYIYNIYRYIYYIYIYIYILHPQVGVTSKPGFPDEGKIRHKWKQKTL